MLPLRASIIQTITSRSRPWDLVIIGGGATGLGCALDAASRGYEVLLIERADFGSGTSSRSTKIIHGGIRYLRSLEWSLVRESLEERALLYQLAPHVVRKQNFVIPFYSQIDRLSMSFGVKLYSHLAPSTGSEPFSGVDALSVREMQEHFPALAIRGLRGGILYRDGQFDDVRMLLSLAKTAHCYGATLLNYCSVTGMRRDSCGRIVAVKAIETESGAEFDIEAKVIVNAAGPYSDQVRALAGDPSVHVAPSQGIHLVFDRELFPSSNALLIPKTFDRRVMFLIPWHEKLLVGTTDHTVDAICEHPQPRNFEIDEVLQAIAPYMSQAPHRSDIRATFAGLRPLAASRHGMPSRKLPRDFVIDETCGTLLSIKGGKWTSYRRMAVAAIDRAAAMAGLPPTASHTAKLPLQGHSEPKYTGRFEGYGSDAQDVEALEASSPEFQVPLIASRPETVGQVIYAVRHEMARTVEDVLGRRLRTLFLDTEAALGQAGRVGSIIAAECGFDSVWQENQIAQIKDHHGWPK